MEKEICRNRRKFAEPLTDKDPRLFLALSYLGYGQLWGESVAPPAAKDQARYEVSDIVGKQPLKVASERPEKRETSQKKDNPSY
jgi:hypothetical protein